MKLPGGVRTHLQLEEIGAHYQTSCSQAEVEGLLVLLFVSSKWI